MIATFTLMILHNDNGMLALIVVPKTTASLWFTLGFTARARVVPALLRGDLSLAASDRAQGRAMGNNQSVQVGAEAVSVLVRLTRKETHAAGVRVVVTADGAP
jgi:hypothetical protein